MPAPSSESSRCVKSCRYCNFAAYPIHDSSLQIVSICLKSRFTRRINCVSHPRDPSPEESIWVTFYRFQHVLNSVQRVHPFAEYPAVSFCFQNFQSAAAFVRECHHHDGSLARTKSLCSKFSRPWAAAKVSWVCKTREFWKLEFFLLLLCTNIMAKVRFVGFPEMKNKTV